MEIQITKNNTGTFDQLTDLNQRAYIEDIVDRLFDLFPRSIGNCVKNKSIQDSKFFVFECDRVVLPRNTCMLRSKIIFRWYIYRLCTTYYEFQMTRLIWKILLFPLWLIIFVFAFIQFIFVLVLSPWVLLNSLCNCCIRVSESPDRFIGLNWGFLNFAYINAKNSTILLALDPVDPLCFSCTFADPEDRIQSTFGWFNWIGFINLNYQGGFCSRDNLKRNIKDHLARDFILDSKV
jgi:hypothetical protein